MMNKITGKPYYQAVIDILNTAGTGRILDIACGDGWLGKTINHSADLDGIDAYNSPGVGYSKYFRADINQGIPSILPKYGAVVICEAMSYVCNPGLLLASIRDHMEDNGILIISDPNPLFIGARLNYLVQGFVRSHSAFVNINEPIAHMPWNSISLFQYWLLLGLNGFHEITLHDISEKKPKHIWEKPFGAIAKLYCRNRLKKSINEHERSLWHQASSDQHVYGRHLVISAVCRRVL